MPTQCSENQLEFQGLGGRRVVASFDAGHVSSDGVVLLLKEVDARLKLCERMAACFADHRAQDLAEHSVETLVRQRVYGSALGYEDLNDHDELRRDPLVAAAVGMSDPEGRTRNRARVSRDGTVKCFDDSTYFPAQSFEVDRQLFAARVPWLDTRTAPLFNPGGSGTIVRTSSLACASAQAPCRLC